MSCFFMKIPGIFYVFSSLRISKQARVFSYFLLLSVLEDQLFFLTIEYLLLFLASC